MPVGANTCELDDYGVRNDGYIYPYTMDSVGAITAGNTLAEGNK